MGEWKTIALKDITDLVIDYRGKTPLKLGRSWCDSGYRALSAKNIKTGRIVNHDDIRFVDEELYRLWMKDEVCRGDILITSEAPFGEVLYWDSDEKIVLSQRLFDVRLNDNVDHRFVYYYMTTRAFKAELDGRSSGTTVVGLRQPELLKCKISLPERTTQKKIAEVLKSLDDKIELNNRINHNLEEQAQALFKSWFVVFEPFKDERIVDTEYGTIPKGWRVGTLNELIDIKYGKDHKKLGDGDIPVYGSGGLMRKANKYLYDKESVLIPRKGSLNNIMYVNSPFWTVDTMFYTVMKQPNVAKYVHQFMLLQNLGAMNTGSAVPSMTTDVLNNLKIVIPNSSVLESFDKVASSLYNMISVNTKQNERLALLRDTLLPKLMSGEIRV